MGLILKWKAPSSMPPFFYPTEQNADFMAGMEALTLDPKG